MDKIHWENLSEADYDKITRIIESIFPNPDRKLDLHLSVSAAHLFTVLILIAYYRSIVQRKLVIFMGLIPMSIWKQARSKGDLSRIADFWTSLAASGFEFEPSRPSQRLPAVRPFFERKT